MERKTLCRRMVSLLYPQRCRYCGKVIDIRETVCESCRSGLREITGEICLNCGCKKNDCRCKGHSRYWRALAAPFYYDGAAGKAIRYLKFQGRKESAEILSEAMTVCFFERFSEFVFEYISFVPMTKKDEKKRGFNQAEILAEKLSENTGIPKIQTLEKTYETEPQHLLSEIERTGNLLGVFSATDAVKIKDARILLIDDVCTTGSTLNECAKTLLIAGAAEVLCLTAAIVKPKGGIIAEGQ